MTESRVETLLQQMSLAKPTAELDDKVMAIINESAAVTRRSPERRVVWKPVVAAAVACLLIGVVVGRATASKAAAEERTTAAVERAIQVAANEPWKLENRSMHLRIADSQGEQKIMPTAAGPRVAILCSQDAPAAKEKRCSKCHSGVTEDPGFSSGVAYVHNLHQQLCVKCHVSAEESTPRGLKDSVLDEPLPTG